MDHTSITERRRGVTESQQRETEQLILKDRALRLSKRKQQLWSDLIEAGEIETGKSGNANGYEPDLIAKTRGRHSASADHFEDLTADVLASTTLFSFERTTDVRIEKTAPIENIHQRRSGKRSVPPGT